MDLHPSPVRSVLARCTSHHISTTGCVLFTRIVAPHLYTKTSSAEPERNDAQSAAWQGRRQVLQGGNYVSHHHGPLDTSSFGEHALPSARSIACSVPTNRATTLHLVHVYVPIYLTMLNDATVGGVPILDATADAQSQTREQEYLATLRTTLDGMPGVEVRCTLLHGPVAAALAEHAEVIGADLIVMTTHGRGGMSRTWLSNVADAVMRHGCRPVLMVRPHETTPAPAHATPLKRILVPLDGSPLAEQALEPARKLDPSGTATYVLMQAIPPFVFAGICRTSMLTSLIPGPRSANAPKHRRTSNVSRAPCAQKDGRWKRCYAVGSSRRSPLGRWHASSVPM